MLVHLRQAIFVACALLLLPSQVRAQESEDLVARARTLAFDKQRAEALTLLEKRLADHPTDSDARTFYGIVLSWEGRYDEARKALESVLEGNPTHADALPALVNVELWSDHPDRAEDLTNLALKARPNDTSLMIAKARALRNQNRPGNAVDVLDRLLEVDPTNLAAKEMKENLKDSARNWAASFDQSYEWFNDRSGWLETQLSLKQQTHIGSVIVRVSHARRFSLDSNLIEVDAYPSIRPGTYAYLSVGWSPDSKLYPDYRLGAELFQSLHHGVEVSGGIRHLGFNSKVNIFTGSATKYYGSWLFTARTYVTPDATAGDSVSMQYSARRYFSEAGTYAGFRIGHGSAPTETGSINEIEVLRSLSFTGEFNWRIARRWSFNLRGGESREDRINNPRLHHHLVDGAVYFRF